MGYAIVLWVYEDAIRDCERSKEIWESYRPDVGEAVLQVCIGGKHDVESAPIKNHGNAVNRFAELHSTWLTPIAWSGNRLAHLSQLNDVEFHAFYEKIQKESRRRGFTSASELDSGTLEGDTASVKTIACPNCYRSQSWYGNIGEISCTHCGHLIPVRSMAQALIHLFCAPTQNNPEGREGYELLCWLDDTGWGDAMYIGRHDWVLAGCPVTTQDFCTIIKTADDLRLMAIARLLSQSEMPNALKRSVNHLTKVVIERLASENNQDNRERLYDILNNFPMTEALSVLERLASEYPSADGNPETPVGSALAQAMEACRRVNAGGG
jgi:hypothetical protein